MCHTQCCQWPGHHGACVCIAVAVMVADWQACKWWRWWQSAVVCCMYVCLYSDCIVMVAVVVS